MINSDNAIEVCNLRFAYGGDVLFDDVSLAVPRGAIAALIGPNGAGKSTLMHCITGIFPPLSGDILIDGKSLYADINAARARMGYLPDNFGLYPDLTVLQHLQFTRATIADASVDMDATIARMDLRDLLGSRPTALSRGQRQRLGIAMAILRQPAIILLDEPASGLDPAARMELSNLLARLKDDGATLLVSSHILSELREYATHYIIINNGVIEKQGELTMSAGDDASAWRLRLRDADDSARAIAVLAGADAFDITRGDDEILFALADEQSAPAVLRAMITADIAVVEFHQHQPGGVDIQRVYQQHIAA